MSYPICQAARQPDGKFCSQCGKLLKSLAHCQACDIYLPDHTNFCPRCGAAATAAEREEPVEAKLDSELLARIRQAFFGRLQQRIALVTGECSRYALMRLLARRAIDLDIAASLSDLASIVSAAAGSHGVCLRPREVFGELTGFFAAHSAEIDAALTRLELLARQDSILALPEQCPDDEIGILIELDQVFFDFVRVYERLFYPVCEFAEKELAAKCLLSYIQAGQVASGTESPSLPPSCQ